MLLAGTRLGPYEVLSPLGAGGMGEVYRARDTKLGRDVALKILPAEFALDPDRLVRFKREAQVLASLNHPHIAAIYGFEDASGTHALVLELVDGPTLADRTGNGPVPLDEALPIARQIVDALEAAHEQGIIHRDLKPANIKLRPDGTVKVLDFGLAKALEPAGARSGDFTASPTITTPAMMTGVGMILGTAAYMSPEQAKGRPADKRSDVWAFGCVLYEMLTGTRAFEGEDIADTLATVLKSEPDWTRLGPDVPASIRALLKRCLDKDRKRRVADISTVRFVIDEPLVAASPVTEVSLPVARQSVWRRALPVAAGAIVAGTLVAIGAWTLKPSATPPIVTRFSFTLPDGVSFTETGPQLISISPDGAHTAYAANNRLYLRSMSDFEAKPIAGTEANAGRAQAIGGGSLEPVFSPDGRSIAFWSSGLGGNAGIRRVAITGGTPIPICTCRAFSMSWGPGGILFAREGKDIMRVAPDGGQPELLVSVKDGLAWDPQMLPGGEAVLFTFAPGIAAQSNAPPNTWLESQIVVHSLKSGERKVLPMRGSAARYVQSGHIVYAVGGTLFAAPFDVARREVTGGTVPVVEGVRRPSLTGAPTGVSYYGVSDTGSLLYMPGPVSASSGGTELAYVDAKGTLEPLKLRPSEYQFPRISPDGKKVAVGTDDGKDTNVWIGDLSGASAIRQLTFSGKNRFPIWSGNSERVAFQSDREKGALAIFAQRADGNGPAEPLTTPEPGTSDVPETWSPDGRTLLFARVKGTDYELWALSLQDKKMARFGDTRSKEPIGATFSPDGRWVAYMSSDGAARTILVQPFPATGDKFRIAGGGWHPVWSPDGRQLVYRMPSGRFEAVRITTQPSFSVSNPEVASISGLRTRGIYEREYDIAADGKRFLGVVPIGQTQLSAGPPQMNVVLNWFEELRQRAPAR